MAGLITLGRTIPTIVSAFRSAFKQLRETGVGKVGSTERTARDLPLTLVAGGTLVMLVGIWALLSFRVNPGASGNFLSAVLIVIFGFFFATVSARIVGLLGNSSNPISGMTIATLVATCLIFVLIGWTGNIYAAVALSIGAVVCISAASGGATTQDLKTGFLVGATPASQEIGLAIGVLTSVFVIGVTLMGLNKIYTKVKPVEISQVQLAPEMKPQGRINYQGHEYEVLSVLGSKTVPDGRYYYDAERRGIGPLEASSLSRACCAASAARAASSAVSSGP